MSLVDTSPLDYTDNGPALVIGCTILAFITTVVVGLRFYSKRLSRNALGWDDWLCLSALLTHHAVHAAACVGSIDGGIGRDNRLALAEDPNSVRVVFQALFVAEIGYTLSSPLIKLSVLAFYWRLFPTRFVRSGCITLACMCGAWFIAVQILNFVQCRPLRALWDVALQALPGTQCLDPILCFFANSIANSIIDFFTLTLPIRAVSKLHTSRRRKLQICCVFLLGSIAFAASLVRTISTGEMWRVGTYNFTKQFYVSAVATVIEIYAAIIGACLPTMLPIYRKIRYGEAIRSINTTGDSKSTKNSNVSGSAGSSARTRKQFSNLASTDGTFQRLSEDAAHPIDHRGPGEYAMTGVRKQQV